MEYFNLALGVLALIVGLHANYQSSAYRNLKVTISDITLSKYNNYDPYLLEFNLNNHSSISLELVTFNFFLDNKCIEPLNHVSNPDINPVGWEPPQPNEPIYINGREITSFPQIDFNFVQAYQYDNVIENNTVIHASTSKEARYYIESPVKVLYAKIQFDRKISFFSKTKVIPIYLKPPTLMY